MRSRGNTFWAVSPSPFDFYGLMAQMKAYTIWMKNWTLICGMEYLCTKVLKKWMCYIKYLSGMR